MTKGPVTRKRIGVLMGGLSSERDVSMRSGLAIYQTLQELGYDAVLIDVDRDIAAVLKKQKIRLAFLALHGGTGENGAIQGLLDVLGIPYTGSGILASSLAMDKEASRKIFLHHGLAAAPFIVLRKKKTAKKHKEVKEVEEVNGKPDVTGAYTFPDFPEPPFEPPWVVKPAAEGSSVGVNIARERAALDSCVEKAFSFGERVIIEKFIKGREVHIGVLGEKILGGVEVRPSLEFYNYEAKYTSGLTDYIIPPEIEETIYEDIKKLAYRAHCSIGCSGASRVDFILDENNTPFILEVNTLPGMTTTSLLPKVARASGLEFKDLIEEIVRLAVKG